MRQKKHIPEVAILVDTATGWGRRLVSGILSWAQAHGPWHVWIEPRGQTEPFSLPKGWAGDGVIARVSSEQMANHLKKIGVPIVNISEIALPSGPGFPRVGMDGDAQARLAYSFLRSRGFRHFGYVGPLELPYVRHRYDQFNQVLEEEGMSCHLYPDRKVSVPTSKNRTSMRELAAWLRELPKPVAVYTWGSEVGRDVIDACLWDGIAVPYDVAVLGSDFDALLCDASYPPQSGIVVPSEQMGRRSAELLDQLMLSKTVKPGPPILIPPEKVMERLSTDTLAIEDAQVANALRFIREHACDPVTVADVLVNVPMSRRALERKFTQYLGWSPSSEITRIRIARAQRLLAETEMSAAEIAEACGYTSYNYLSHIFKKVAGQSPQSYRKQARR